MRFPCDPHMPRWRLEKFNVELRELDRRASYQASPSQTSQSVHSGIPRHYNVQAPSELEVRNLSDWPHHAHLQGLQVSAEDIESLLKSTAPVDSVDLGTTEHDTYEPMPDTAFIRSRRLAYFIEKEKLDDRAQAEADAQQKSTNITTLMKAFGIDPQRAAEHERRIAAKQHEGNSGDIGDIMSQMAMAPPLNTVPQRSFESQRSGTLKIAIDAEADAISQAAVDQESRKEPIRVPLTLLPNMSTEERPRDEDPRVMPIPRELDFKFDVRQLRDLAVIKEGGNGCAIDGYEFEVQSGDDEEWIGSGLVDLAENVEDGRATAYESVEQEQYEYGKGDEDGLLNELPGL